MSSSLGDNSSEPSLTAAQRSRVRRLAARAHPDLGEQAGELNVIPYLDIIMNIVVFVVATLSLVWMITIDVQPGGINTQIRDKPRAATLTVLVVDDGIGMRTADGNIATGCTGVGAGVTIPKVDGRHDFSAVTRCARLLKSSASSYAGESQVTLSANPGTDLKTMVSLMDALREDEQGPLFGEVRFGVPH